MSGSSSRLSFHFSLDMRVVNFACLHNHMVETIAQVRLTAKLWAFFSHGAFTQSFHIILKPRIASSGRDISEANVLISLHLELTMGKESHLSYTSEPSNLVLMPYNSSLYFQIANINHTAGTILTSNRNNSSSSVTETLTTL
jgi:hypothetical protein